MNLPQPCSTPSLSQMALQSPPLGSSPIYLDLFLVPACFDELRTMMMPLLSVAALNQASIHLSFTPFTWTKGGWAGASPAVAIAIRFLTCAQNSLVSEIARTSVLQCFFGDASLSSQSTSDQVLATAQACSTSLVVFESVTALQMCVSPTVSQMQNVTINLMDGAQSTALSYLNDAFVSNSITDQPFYAFLQGLPLCLDIWDSNHIAQQFCLAQLRPTPTVINSTFYTSDWTAPQVAPINSVVESPSCFIVDSSYSFSCSTPQAIFRSVQGLLAFVPIVSLFLLSVSLVSLLCMMIVRRRQRRTRRSRTLRRQAAERHLGDVLELLSQLSAFERAANHGDDAIRHAAEVDQTLASLPKRTVAVVASAPNTSTETSTKDAVAQETCCICLEPMGVNGSNTYFVLPGCRHIHHSECLRQWLLSGKYDCPVCRTYIVRPPTVTPLSSSSMASSSSRTFGSNGAESSFSMGLAAAYTSSISASMTLPTSLGGASPSQPGLTPRGEDNGAPANANANANVVRPPRAAVIPVRGPSSTAEITQT